MKSEWKPVIFLLQLASLLCLSGCGAGPDPAAEIVAKRNRTNIQKVANAYILFSALKHNRGPRSKDELVEFVKNKPSIDRNLGLMGIERDDFEKCFVSESDLTEVDVRWGLRINPDGAAVPLVFETKGVDGVRRVALSGGRVLEVDDDKKYKNLMAGKIKQADAGEAIGDGSGQDSPDS